jgi:hypothetical protein
VDNKLLAAALAAEFDRQAAEGTQWTGQDRGDDPDDYGLDGSFNLEKVAEVAQGWQPIDTAPLNGEEIDVWADGTRITNVFWSAPHQQWARKGWRLSRGASIVATHVFTDMRPTHWRHTPGAPT